MLNKTNLKQCSSCNLQIEERMILGCGHELCLSCATWRERIDDGREKSVICIKCNQLSNKSQIKIISNTNQGHITQSVNLGGGARRPQFCLTASSPSCITENSTFNNFEEQKEIQRLTFSQSLGRKMAYITPEKITEKILDMSPKQHSDAILFNRRHNIQSQEQIQQQQQQLYSKSQSHYLGKDEGREFNEFTFPQSKSLSQSKTQISSHKENNNVQLCLEHNEEFSLFCEKDKKLCCMNCVYGPSSYHKNHRVLPLKHSQAVMRQELDLFKMKNKEILHKIDDKIKQRQTNKNQILKSFVCSKELIHSEFQRLLQQILMRQSQIFEEIESQYSSKVKEIEASVQSLTEIRAQFKNFKELETIATKNTGLEQIIKAYSQKQILSKSLKGFENCSSNEVYFCEISQIDLSNKTTLLQEISFFGRLKSSSQSKSGQPLKQNQLNKSNSKSQLRVSGNASQSSQNIQPRDSKNSNNNSNSNVNHKQENEKKQEYIEITPDLPARTISSCNKSQLRSISLQGAETNHKIPSINKKSFEKEILTQDLYIEDQNQNSRLKTSVSSMLISPHHQLCHLTAPSFDLFDSLSTVEAQQQQCFIQSQQSQYDGVCTQEDLLHVAAIQREGEQNLNQSGFGNKKPPLMKQSGGGVIDKKLEKEEIFDKQDKFKSANVHQDSNKHFINGQEWQSQQINHSTNLYQPLKNNFISCENSLSAQIRKITKDLQEENEDNKENKYLFKDTDFKLKSANRYQQQSIHSSIPQMREELNNMSTKSFTQNDSVVSSINKSQSSCSFIATLALRRENILQQSREKIANTSNKQLENSQAQPISFNQSQSFSNLQEKDENLVVKSLNTQDNEITKQEKKEQQNHQQQSQQSQRQSQQQSQQQSQRQSQQQSQQQQSQQQPQQQQEQQQQLLQQQQIVNRQSRSSSLIKSQSKSPKQKSVLNKTGDLIIVQSQEIISQSLTIPSIQDSALKVGADRSNDVFTFKPQNSLGLQDQKQPSSRISQEDQQINQPILEQSIGFLQTESKQLRNSFTSSEQNLIFQESDILVKASLKEKLLQILPFKIKQTQKLYSTLKDTVSSESFHDKCDGKGPYLLIAKVENNIFGYYSPISFVQCDKYITCSSSFLFSLINVYGTRPFLIPIRPDKKYIALYQSTKNPCLGTTLQNKQDLWINFDDLNASFSSVGYAYSLDKRYDGSKILAGSYTNWKVDSVEIFNVSTIKA